MNTKYATIITLFVIYIAILIKLLFFKYPLGMTFEIVHGNFVPFKTILNYLSGEPTWIIAIRNVWGNIMLFIPFGIFIPLLCRTFKWKSVLATAFVISATLEITQGIFRAGVFDVDDILLNILGVAIGYGVFVCIKVLLYNLRRASSQHCYLFKIINK